MGIHDRGYYRDSPPPGFDIGWNGKSPVSMIIIISVACFVLNLFVQTGDGRRFSDLMALHASDLSRPWMWWRMLTYGFVHSYQSIGHILFNMMSLWFLGRAVEERYGWSEFWRIYLLSLVFCGAIYLALHNFFDQPGTAVLGASGAVLTITMLFVFNFPFHTISIFGIFPVPAWAVGVFIVVMNLLVRPSPENPVAYDVHLAGIAFAAVYFYGNLNFNFLENWTARYRVWKRNTFGPKLKPYREPELDSEAVEADRILAKIQQSGLDSLTAKEQKFMAQYSKKVRAKKNVQP